jgi:hypothetical protein
MHNRAAPYSQFLLLVCRNSKCDAAEVLLTVEKASSMVISIREPYVPVATKSDREVRMCNGFVAQHLYECDVPEIQVATVVRAIAMLTSGNTWPTAIISSKPVYDRMLSLTAEPVSALFGEGFMFIGCTWRWAEGENFPSDTVFVLSEMRPNTAENNGWFRVGG